MNQTHPQARCYLASRPGTPQSALLDLAKDKDTLVRIAVASNVATPPEGLTILAVDDNTFVRRCVVSNPSTLPEDLVVLSMDQDIRVRCDVAHSPSTPASTLAVLATDKEVAVRRIVACNRATPPPSLILLSKDEREVVRYWAANNPSLPAPPSPAATGTAEVERDALQAENTLLKKALERSRERPKQTVALTPHLARTIRDLFHKNCDDVLDAAQRAGFENISEVEDAFDALEGIVEGSET